MENISPATTVALARFFAAKAKAANLSPGKHRVRERVTLDVDAVLNKAEDELYAATTSIPTKALLAFLLPHLGEDRDEALQVLRDAMALAVSANVKADKTLAVAIKDVDREMAKVQSFTSNLPNKIRSGKVTGDVHAELNSVSA